MTRNQIQRDSSQDHLNSKLGKKIEAETESFKSNLTKVKSKIRIGSVARKDSLNGNATLDTTKPI